VTFKLFTLLETDPEYQKRQLQMIGQIIQGLPNRASNSTWLRTLAVMIVGSARTTVGESTSAGASTSFRSKKGGWFDFGSTRAGVPSGQGIRRDVYPGSELTGDVADVPVPEFG